MRSLQTKLAIAYCENYELEYEKDMREIDLLFARWDVESKEFEALGEKFWNHIRADSDGVIIPEEHRRPKFIEPPSNDELNKSDELEEKRLNIFKELASSERCIDTLNDLLVEENIQKSKSQNLEDILGNITRTAEKMNHSRYNIISPIQLADGVAQTSFPSFEDSKFNNTYLSCVTPNYKNGSMQNSFPTFNATYTKEKCVSGSVFHNGSIPLHRQVNDNSLQTSFSTLCNSSADSNNSTTPSGNLSNQSDTDMLKEPQAHVDLKTVTPKTTFIDKQISVSISDNLDTPIENTKEKVTATFIDEQISVSISDNLDTPVENNKETVTATSVLEHTPMINYSKKAIDFSQITISSVNTTDGNSDFINPNDTGLDIGIVKKTHQEYQDLELDFINPNDTNQLNTNKRPKLRPRVRQRNVPQDLPVEVCPNTSAESFGTEVVPEDVAETSQVNQVETPKESKLTHISAVEKNITNEQSLSNSIDFHISPLLKVQQEDESVVIVTCADVIPSNINTIPTVENEPSYHSIIDYCEPVEDRVNEQSRDKLSTRKMTKAKHIVKPKRRRKRHCISMPKNPNERTKFVVDSKYTFTSYNTKRNTLHTPQPDRKRKVYQIKRSVALSHITPSKNILSPSKSALVEELKFGETSVPKSRHVSMQINISGLTENIEATQEACEFSSDDMTAGECAECSVELSRKSDVGTPIDEILCEKCVCVLQRRDQTINDKTVFKNQTDLLRRTLLRNSTSVGVISAVADNVNLQDSVAKKSVAYKQIKSKKVTANNIEGTQTNPKVGKSGKSQKKIKKELIHEISPSAIEETSSNKDVLNEKPSLRKEYPRRVLRSRNKRISTSESTDSLLQWNKPAMLKQINTNEANVQLSTVVECDEEPIHNVEKIVSTVSTSKTPRSRKSGLRLRKRKSVGNSDIIHKKHRRKSLIEPSVKVKITKSNVKNGRLNLKLKKTKSLASSSNIDSSDGDDLKKVNTQISKPGAAGKRSLKANSKKKIEKKTKHHKKSSNKIFNQDSASNADDSSSDNDMDNLKEASNAINEDAASNIESLSSDKDKVNLEEASNDNDEPTQVPTKNKSTGKRKESLKKKIKKKTKHSAETDKKIIDEDSPSNVNNSSSDNDKVNLEEASNDNDEPTQVPIKKKSTGKEKKIIGEDAASNVDNSSSDNDKVNLKEASNDNDETTQVPIKEKSTAKDNSKKESKKRKEKKVNHGEKFPPMRVTRAKKEIKSSSDDVSLPGDIALNLPTTKTVSSKRTASKRVPKKELEINLVSNTESKISSLKRDIQSNVDIKLSKEEVMPIKRKKHVMIPGYSKNLMEHGTNVKVTRKVTRRIIKESSKDCSPQGRQGNKNIQEPSCNLNSEKDSTDAVATIATTTSSDEFDPEIVLNLPEEYKDFNKSSQLKSDITDSDIDETDDDLLTHHHTVIENNKTKDKKETKVLVTVKTPTRSKVRKVSNTHSRVSVDDISDADDSIRPIPFAQHQAKFKTDGLMKPPMEPAPKKSNRLNVSKASAYPTVNSSKFVGESTMSYLGRKKKMLFNKSKNSMRTPNRGAPMNSTLMEGGGRRSVAGSIFSEDISKIGQPTLPEISVISKVANATNTSNISNVTYGMPSTLSNYLKNFGPAFGKQK